MRKQAPATKEAARTEPIPATVGNTEPSAKGATTAARQNAPRVRAASKAAAVKASPAAEPAPPAKATPAKAASAPAPKAKAEKQALAKPVASKPEAAPVKAGKTKKQPEKKARLVRDSFSIPEADYALFASLKQRALTAGSEVKKSELLRAALSVLNALDDASFAKALAAVERIKTGRPKK